MTPEETDLRLERLHCYLFERLTMNKVLLQLLSFILMFWSNDQGQHNAGILGTVPHSKNALGLKSPPSLAVQWSMHDLHVTAWVLSRCSVQKHAHELTINGSRCERMSMYLH